MNLTSLHSKHAYYMQHKTIIMISLHYTSHTKAYNTIYTACNIVEAIYSFTNRSNYDRQTEADSMTDRNSKKA